MRLVIKNNPVNYSWYNHSCKDTFDKSGVEAVIASH